MGWTERIEQSLLGDNWALDSTTFWQRLLFFRDTGLWPSLHDKESLEIHMRSNIALEEQDGKKFCANQKRKRCKGIGLTI